MIKILDNKITIKEGNKHEVSNNIPVSLLTSFSKIFEKIMQSRLVEHLTKNNILSMEQYGFNLEIDLYVKNL
jgi:hypothetical protein